MAKEKDLKRMLESGEKGVGERGSDGGREEKKRTEKPKCILFCFVFVLFLPAEKKWIQLMYA